MEYTTYLFDFDYTLADSSRGIVICFRHVLENHGYPNITDEQIKRTIGKPLEESFTILTGIDDAQTLATYRKEYVKEADEHMNVNTFLFPETLPVLHELKKRGAKIGIISTKYRYRIQEVVDNHFPKGFFDIIIGGEDVKEMKPNQQGILKALKKLHRNVKETLYIGDSTVDALTALNAKVDFVGILNGVTTHEELAQYPNRQILNSLTLLPLVQHSSVYKPYKFPPQKMEAIYRLTQIKLIQGRQTLDSTPFETSTCKNCGETYIGNYCPRCGQTKDTPRFSIRNAFQNILSGFFNIDSGFSRNLLEFLCRPGYMIRNYLDGKRVHYFKPFQTLFVLAALYVMMVQMVDPEAMHNTAQGEMEYTYETLQNNFKELKSETTSHKTLNFLDKSAFYADSARIAEEESDTIITEKFSFNHPMSVELSFLLANKMEAAGENPDIRALILELSDSLAREDSIQLQNANQTESILIREKAKQRKQILKQFRSNREDANIHISDSWKSFSDKYLAEDSFIMAVFNMMKGWIHGNKAFSIVALLPIFTFGVKWGFRRTPIGRRLNTTELFFSQVYIASQFLWFSILVLPFTGKAHLDDVFDLHYGIIFILFVWDLHQMFGVSWWYSLKRTLISFCYCLLLIIGISIILTFLALLLVWGVSGENPFDL